MTYCSTKQHKAWLIPSKYFDLDPDGADWGCNQNQEDVTNCNQNLVTEKNHHQSSTSASYDDDVTIVTKKEEEEEEGGLEKNSFANFAGDGKKNSSSPKKIDFSPAKMVTTVTDSKTTQRQGVQPVTNCENNWSHPVTMVTTDFSSYPYLTSNDEITEKETITETKPNQELQPVTPTDNQLVTEVTACNQDLEQEHQVKLPPMDWDELVKGMDEEMKRLDWSVEDGVVYLLHKYNKKSRQLLTDGEALEFYEFLSKRKSKYVVGERVIVTHTLPEFNGQIAEVVSVLPNNILKVKFNNDRQAREVCGVFVSHYFSTTVH